MRIGIEAHPDKPGATAFVPELVTVLESLGAQPVLPEALAQKVHKNSYGVEDIFAQADCIAALGGDGLLLKCAQFAAPRGIPLVGINLGRLGFLSELSTDAQEIEAGFAAILAGEYTLDRRMMLDVRMGERGARFAALNDIVISRAAIAQVIQLDVYVNGEQMDRYIGDGVIIASPTGSTAYSLSANGPVVSPFMECMVISPICPHTLHARPCVVPGDAVVTVRLLQGESNTVAAYDGGRAMELQPGDELTISRAERTADFIRIRPFRFYDLLHEKLKHWR